MSEDFTQFSESCFLPIGTRVQAHFEGISYTGAVENRSLELFVQTSYGTTGHGLACGAGLDNSFCLLLQVLSLLYAC